jgi:hypothetical protein
MPTPKELQAERRFHQAGLKASRANFKASTGKWCRQRLANDTGICTRKPGHAGAHYNAKSKPGGHNDYRKA